MGLVLAFVQVLVLAIIVTILHAQMGAGPIVCGALLIAGVFLTLGEMRALNYAAVRKQHPGRRIR